MTRVGAAVVAVVVSAWCGPARADELRDAEIDINGFTQLDLRVYEPDHPGDTAFALRRAQFDLSGKLPKRFKYRFAGELATPRIAKAWIDYVLADEIKLRMGFFKVPFGLERRYAARWMRFNERGLGPGAYGPNYDLGAKVFGKLLDGRLEYDAAVLNGSGRSADTNDALDVALRVGARPVAGWYVGVSGTIGRQDEDLSGDELLTGVRTAYFTFADGVTHEGSRRRAAVETAWSSGRLLLYSELMWHERRNVVGPGGSEDVRMIAWYAAGSVLLTDHAQPQTNGPEPKGPVIADGDSVGAIELHARFDQLILDEGALASGAATGSPEVWSAVAGVGWWPSKHARLSIDGTVAGFEDGPMDNELAALARAQFMY